MLYIILHISTNATIIILHISTNATIIILRYAARVAKILQAFDNLNA